MRGKLGFDAQLLVHSFRPHPRVSCSKKLLFSSSITDEFEPLEANTYRETRSATFSLVSGAGVGSVGEEEIAEAGRLRLPSFGALLPESTSIGSDPEV